MDDDVRIQALWAYMDKVGQQFNADIQATLQRQAEAEKQEKQLEHRQRLAEIAAEVEHRRLDVEGWKLWPW